MLRSCYAFLLLCLLASAPSAHAADPVLEALRVPPGFHISLFAEGLARPRLMALGPDGVLHVAETRAGRVIALPDRQQRGQADRIEVLATGLPEPGSLAWHQGAWYVGVPRGVIRLSAFDSANQAADAPKAGGMRHEWLIDDYPTSGHSTRTVAFLPSGELLVSVGSSCNVCIESDSRRASVMIYDDPARIPPGSGKKLGAGRIYANGLRNAVGLALDATGQPWASNNGRDHLGDEEPPETLYRLTRGAFYGWPYCHAARIIDPDFGRQRAAPCQNVGAPALEIGAHQAPLGMAFYPGGPFPATYRGQLFLALHGSWNRSQPAGYRVARIAIQAGKASEVASFIEGWLRPDGRVLGRPAGVAVGADGALYVSDDLAGRIYRVTYVGEGKTSAR